jgi:probable phosphoglycerate mutase
VSIGAQQVWLVRHGETEWSRSGRHTSVTDLPLTPVGERTAIALAPRLAERAFSLVLSSPRERARRTADLAGLAGVEIDEDLAEWHYGDYEGVTTAEIRTRVPRWTVWDGPVPGGETAEQVTTRLDRVIERVAATDGDVLLVAHGHSLRALTARWLGLPGGEGRRFWLDTATVSVLGHERESRVILRWNT